MSISKPGLTTLSMGRRSGLLTTEVAHEASDLDVAFHIPLDMSMLALGRYPIALLPLMSYTPTKWV